MKRILFLLTFFISLLAQGQNIFTNPIIVKNGISSVHDLLTLQKPDTTHLGIKFINSANTWYTYLQGNDYLIRNSSFDVAKFSKTGNLTLNGSISLLETGSSPHFYTTIQSGNLTANRTFTLPNTYGTSGYFLKTDGSGGLSWDAAGGSSSLTIGTTPIINGVTSGILFKDSNGVLQNDTFLFFDRSKNKLSVGNDTLYHQGVWVWSGGYPSSWNTCVGAGSGSLLSYGMTDISLFGHDCADGLLSGAQTTILGASAADGIGHALGTTIVGSRAAHQTVVNVPGVGLNYATLVGAYAGYDMQGGYSVGVGFGVLRTTTSGNELVAVGNYAGASNTTHVRSNFLGYNAGANADADDGIYLGTFSGGTITSGKSNLCIGNHYNDNIPASLGPGITTGDSNTVIGSWIKNLPDTLSNSLVLANSAGNVRILSNHIGVTQIYGRSVSLPQMTTTQINALVDPVDGEMIFNISLGTICFYYGGAWQKVSFSGM